ncbi:MAG: site-specific integrase, partial [Candidatus Tumulicola sp.]
NERERAGGVSSRPCNAFSRIPLLRTEVIALACGILVHLTLVTGLRRGELLALKWEDVDFGRRVLAVRRALEQLAGGVVAFKDTKTKRSRRGVALTPDALELLKAHRAEQNATRLAREEATTPTA